MNREEIRGLKVLVMGLGLHGGGVDTAWWLASTGAQVTVTDLREEDVLGESLKELEGLPIRFVLGEHRDTDFADADMVVKNPAVPIDSPWLEGVENIETDISLFLRLSDNPLLAITGTKGKSTAVTALHHILRTQHPGARLGGNITTSPLGFLDDLDPAEPVILELSSWQLADLRNLGLLRPKIVAITNLLRDHQNRYESFENYEKDKQEIFLGQGDADFAFFPDNDFGHRCSAIAPGNVYLVRKEPPKSAHFLGAWLDEGGIGWMEDGSGAERVVPFELKVPGDAFRLNILFAAAMAHRYGVPAAEVAGALVDFPGAPYRMELFHEKNGVRFYDDTAATIPDAAAEAVRALDRPVILVAGGTDKSLDFEPFDAVANKPKLIVMLSGSATDIWIPRLQEKGARVDGPFNNIISAVERAWHAAEPGDAIILSPGAASFGMFAHEFHRGDAFKAACLMQG